MKFYMVVAQWLAHMPLVLEVHPRQGKVSVSQHAFLSVICRDHNKLVCRPLDREISWMSPVQGKSLHVHVKEPYGNLDMVTCRI